MKQPLYVTCGGSGVPGVGVGVGVREGVGVVGGICVAGKVTDEEEEEEEPVSGDHFLRS